MRRFAFCLFISAAAALAGANPSQQPATQQLAPIAIDYPAEGSIFPPEITPPTFLWRDPDSKAAVWRIDITFAGGIPGLQFKAPGERMRVGEIDPRCVTPTNTPTLTQQQSMTRAWMPDNTRWTTIKAQSITAPATVTITGFSDLAMSQAVSRGQVSLYTSKDPVGAPIFYRDVPLMPTEGEKGTIKPLPSTAIKLIQWRLRNIGETKSRVLMENLPTCANCHSFSLDGKTLGLDVDGPQNDKGLYALVSVKKDASIRNEDVIKWSSFQGRLGDKLRAAFMSQVSPDGRFVVTTIEDPGAPGQSRRKDLLDKYYVANFKDYRFLQVFYPTRGILAWYNRETGQLRPLPGADDTRHVQTDGVWSPDGKNVVFAKAVASPPYPDGWRPAQYANDPNETQIKYDLYRVPFNEGRGGAAEPIAGASRNGMSNNFPKVSPDGRWIVYVGCGNGQLMRPDGKLYIVPSQGGEARLMKCNTPLMNSWHSFSPNGRWLVFSSKSRSPFTQMYLTHLDENGNDSPPILIENATAANRAVNIPEFVNIPPDGLLKIDTPAMEYFRTFDRAVELAQKNRTIEAVVEWKKAVELNPDEAKARFNYALALGKQGQLDEAIHQYQKTIDLDPENASAYTNIAVALASTGRMSQALPYFERAAALEPEGARALSNFGAALIEVGRVDEGISYCRKALEIDPRYADAYNSLGSALAKTDRLDEAIAHLEKAVLILPGSFEYRYNLGRFLAAKGSYSRALPHFEQAVRISGGKEPQSLSMFASMNFEVGRFTEAVRLARQALAIAQSQNNQELASEIRERLAIFEAKIPIRPAP